MALFDHNDESEDKTPTNQPVEAAAAAAAADPAAGPVDQMDLQRFHLINIALPQDKNDSENAGGSILILPLPQFPNLANFALPPILPEIKVKSRKNSGRKNQNFKRILKVKSFGEISDFRFAENNFHNYQDFLSLTPKTQN